MLQHSVQLQPTILCVISVNFVYTTTVWYTTFWMQTLCWQFMQEIFATNLQSCLVNFISDMDWRKFICAIIKHCVYNLWNLTMTQQYGLPLVEISLRLYVLQFMQIEVGLCYIQDVRWSLFLVYGLMIERNSAQSLNKLCVLSVTFVYATTEWYTTFWDTIDFWGSIVDSWLYC